MSGLSFCKTIDPSYYIAGLTTTGFKEILPNNDGHVQFHSLSIVSIDPFSTKVYGKVFGDMVEVVHKIDTGGPGLVEIQRYARPSTFRKLLGWTQLIRNYNQKYRKASQIENCLMDRYPFIKDGQTHEKAIRRAGRILLNAPKTLPLFMGERKEIHSKLFPFLEAIQPREGDQSLVSINIGKTRKQTEIYFNFLREYSEFSNGPIKYDSGGKKEKAGRTPTTAQTRRKRKNLKSILIETCRLLFEDPYLVENASKHLIEESTKKGIEISNPEKLLELVLNSKKNPEFSLAKWAEKQARSIIKDPPKKQ